MHGAGSNRDDAAHRDPGASSGAFARQTALLQAVTAALTRAVTVRDVAEVVTTHGRALFGATASLLYLIDGDLLELEAYGGVPAARVEAYRRVALAGPAALAGAIRDDVPLWLGTRAAVLAASPDLADVADDGAPLVGLVAVPLHDTTTTIGGLAFSFYAAVDLDAVQRDLFLTLASQCGLAIERARAFEAERRARASLEHQQRRLELLARAGEVLAASRGAREALVGLARLVVPQLADWCAIDEVDPAGAIRRLTVEHRDPTRAELAVRLAERYPPDPDAPHGVPRVLRTGETEFVADIPDALLVAAARDDEHLALARSLGLKSYAVVPLTARGRVLGALSLVTDDERRLDEDDVKIAEELGRRAALTLDNVRLYEAAEAARADLHGLFMAAPAAVALCRGPDLDIELANAAFGRHFGGAVGRPLPAAPPGSAAAELRARVALARATGETVVVPELAVADDPSAAPRHFHLVCQALRGPAGVADVMTFAFDISAQVDARREIRRAEAAAREHAETLTTIHDIGRLIVGELDLPKVVQAVTDAATSLSGAQFGAFFYNVQGEAGGSYMLYTLSGVPRAAFAEFPMPRSTDVFAPTFRGEGVVRSDDITQDPRYGHNAPYHGMPAGHLPVRSYLAVPVTARSGEVLGGIFLGHAEPGVFSGRAESLVVGLADQAAVAMDNARLYSEARRLIHALEATNRELDQFAYVTSHDLKAPLRGIASLAEWIEEDLGETLIDPVRRNLGLLRGRVRRMEALIQGILDFSRAGRLPGKHEPVDVARLVLDVAELLAPTPPATVTIDGPLPELLTERVALQQVFLNLISNALKHARRPDARVRITCADDGERWRFCVADNGPGIDPGYRGRVWGIFQTLAARDKVEGTGIGLAIVKKLVEGRGGRAWIDAVDPAAGTGAALCFTWPKREDRRP